MIRAVAHESRRPADAGATIRTCLSRAAIGWRVYSSRRCWRIADCIRGTAEGGLPGLHSHAWVFRISLMSGDLV
ncbi:hypothetical protein [Lysobacter gummosus]|uniref:hypothetical protein n=1 Tax=Lysobacter gummosus TaxID=262324 RepID=UPI003628EEC2